MPFRLTSTMKPKMCPEKFILLIALALFLIVDSGDGIARSSDVQTYVDQAVPDNQADDDRFNSPLRAGQMTLDDVLASHPAPRRLVPAPLTQVQAAPLSPPPATGTASLSAASHNSSTNIMLMQGMKSVLQQSDEPLPGLVPPQLPNNSATGSIEPFHQPRIPTAADIVHSAPSAAPVPLPVGPDMNLHDVSELPPPVGSASATPPVSSSLSFEAGQQPRSLAIPGSHLPATSSRLPGINSLSEGPTPLVSQQVPTVSDLVDSVSIDKPSVVSVAPAGNVPETVAPTGEKVFLPETNLVPLSRGAPMDGLSAQTIPLDKLPVETAPVLQPFLDQTASTAAQPASDIDETVSIGQAPVAPPVTINQGINQVPGLVGPSADSVPHPKAIFPQSKRTAAQIISEQPDVSMTPVTVPSHVERQTPLTGDASTIDDAEITPIDPSIEPQKPVQPNSLMVGGKQGAHKSSKLDCTPQVSSWTRSCVEAGYPASFTGNIRGETHTECPDNSLKDVWVSNTCAAPEDQPTSKPDNTKSQIKSQASPLSANRSAQHSSPRISAVDAPPAGLDAQDGVCGSANGTHVFAAPQNNLCDLGNPGSMGWKSGAWVWSCSGAEGGNSVMCSAGKAVESECGSASMITTQDAPSESLCNSGEPTDVVITSSGSSEWQWSCVNAATNSKVYCKSPRIVDARCGKADGDGNMYRPEKDLCLRGKAGAISAGDEWSWTCSGLNGGEDEGCSAPRLAGGIDNFIDSNKQNTTSEVKHPASNQAASAHVAATEADYSTDGASGVVAAVDADNNTYAGTEGVCGRAAELMAVQLPEKNLCVTGIATDLTGNGPWQWTCADTQGHQVRCSTLSPIDSASDETTAGHTVAKGVSSFPSKVVHATTVAPVASRVHRNAQAVVGNADATTPQCGLSAGLTMTSAPTEDFCMAGAPSPLRGTGPWKWDCATRNGNSVTCGAYKKMDAMCGAADGTVQKYSPAKDLCSLGEPGNVTGTKTWKWVCSSTSSAFSVQCSANKIRQAPKRGVTEDAAPAKVSNAELPKQATVMAAAGTASLPGETTEAVTPAGKPFAQAPEPSDTPLAPTPPDIKVPNEAARLPDNASPVIPPKNIAGAEKAPVEAAVVPPTKSLPSELDKNPAAEVSHTTVPTATELATAPLPGGGASKTDPAAVSIPFAHAAENIDSVGQASIDKALPALEAVNNRITLTAFADGKNLTARESRRLSLARALAVRDYLASKGISSSRVDVRALGVAPDGLPDRVDLKSN